MKECIDEFEVDVDISDRTRLYDYSSCQYVTKAEGETWNKDQFRSMGSTGYVSSSNENLMVQTGMMDRAINETGCLQKQADEKNAPTDMLFRSDFDAFDSSLNLPRRVLPIYSPGDVVRGHLKLKLKKPVQAEELSVNFTGQGLVNIRIYHKHGYYDDTRREKYVDEDVKLWVKSGKGKSDECDFSPLVQSTAPMTGLMIPAGEHSWPFEFRIPLETSQSTPNLRPGSNHYAYVVYRIKGKLDSGNLFGRGDVVTHKGLWVEKQYDIGKELANFEPVEAEETLNSGLIFKSGKITLKAKIPRSAYVKGEDVPISIEIDNQTKGTIDRVTAAIVMHGKFRLSDSRLTMSKSIDVSGTRQVLENLTPGMCPAVDWKLAWDFSESSVDSNLMPTGTLDDCKLIEVQYDVVVKVKRSGLHRNMDLQIPIYVGTHNTRLYPVV